MNAWNSIDIERHQKPLHIFSFAISLLIPDLLLILFTEIQ